MMIEPVTKNGELLIFSKMGNTIHMNASWDILYQLWFYDNFMFNNKIRANRNFLMIDVTQVQLTTVLGANLIQCVHH